MNVFCGVQEYCIVDNFLAAKYDSIKSLDELTEVDLKDALVLITSDSEEVYDELRESLYQKVPREQCLEMFPKPVPVWNGSSLGKEINNLSYHILSLGMKQTAEYITENLPTVTMYSNRYKLMEHLFLDGIVPSEGLCLEFGVREGTSLNFIAAYNPTKTVYGFDSCEWLPENWNFYAPVGIFSLQGKLPKVNDNVKLVKGWFDKTLPDFLKEHREQCAFVHIDSDLYSSAKLIFESLGKQISHGTVIEFDEYFGVPNWRNGEFKAFHEFIDTQKLEYEYLGYTSVGWQCAVRIK